MNKLLHNFEDHSESSISTDFTLAEGTKNSLPTSILIMLDATHSGYRNKNFFLILPRIFPVTFGYSFE